MACPALYEAREIRREPMAESEPALRGQEIHLIISEYIKHCLRTRQQTDYEFLDQLSQRGVNREALEIVRPIGSDLVVDHEQVLGVEMKLALGEEMESVHQHTPDCYLLALSSGESSVPGHLPLICHQPEFPAHYESTLDLVQCPSAEEAVIDDWKSHWQIFAADTFQGELYPLQIFQHYPGIQRVTFRLRFVRYGLGAMTQVEYIRERDLGRLKERVFAERQRQLALHAAYQENSSSSRTEGQMLHAMAMALPGDHCAWCPMVMRCPVRAINPYTNQSPEDLLRFARWCASALAQARGVLKAHVNAYGPVRVQDGNGNETAAAFRLMQKRRYPLTDCQSAIVEWDLANHENLMSKLFISGLSSKLKTKKRAALAAQLEPFSVLKPETRFVITGVEEEESEDEE
jgi:hypothetical protein